MSHGECMILLIDDKRDMPSGVIARDFESGKKMLALGGWEKLYIDHDLGELKTGYHLITEFLENGLGLPDIVHIVSSNPVGFQNIAVALKRHGYKQLGAQFTKE